MDRPEPIIQTQAPGDLLQPLHRQRRHHSSQPRWIRKLRKRVRSIHWRLVAGVLLALLAVVAVAVIALATDANSRIQSSLDSLDRVVASLGRKLGTELTLADFGRLQASVDDVVKTVASAQRQTTILQPLVRLNPDLTATYEALDTTQALALAGQSMLAGIQPTLFYLVGNEEDESLVPQLSSGERIIELLRLGRGQFVRAGEYLTQAQARLDALNLASVSPDFLLNLQALTKVHDQLTGVNELLLNAPDLLTLALGINAEQTYLILAQNSDELRPSGGYISTYGWLRVRNGRVVDYDYSATTAASPQPPSAADMPYQVPSWWIQFQQPVYAAWDGSWSPDFPTTAAMAAWYYNAGGNPHAPVNGVIALDLVGFEYVLEALGDVNVPGYNQTVNADNLREVIYTIRASGEGDLPHKRFLSDLYREIFNHWRSVEDADTSSRLLGATLRALQEQHIMFYFPDVAMNEAVELLGWSGSQAGGAGHDYVLVADANLGNKSNRSVIRQTTYDVSVSPDGSLSSRLSVAYDYPASLADNDPAVNPEHHGPINYNNLLQVYLPPLIALLSEDDEVRPIDVVQTGDSTLLANRFTLPYDTSARFQFTYTTPPLIEVFGPYRRYRLLVEKQPGTLSETINVQLSLPQGSRIVSTSPAVATSYQLDLLILEFNLTLTTDQWVDVIYRADS